jgi:hypothetical protein
MTPEQSSVSSVVKSFCTYANGEMPHCVRLLLDIAHRPLSTAYRQNVPGTSGTSP